jgi:hypothetical protein
MRSFSNSFVKWVVNALRLVTLFLLSPTQAEVGWSTLFRSALAARLRSSAITDGRSKGWESGLACLKLLSKFVHCRLRVDADHCGDLCMQHNVRGKWIRADCAVRFSRFLRCATEGLQGVPPHRSLRPRTLLSIGWNGYTRQRYGSNGLSRRDVSAKELGKW